ncbi:MAG: hypothetical protein ACXVCM_16545 [Ktedonobacteraceae bacterium]
MDDVNEQIDEAIHSLLRAQVAQGSQIRHAFGLGVPQARGFFAAITATVDG